MNIDNRRGNLKSVPKKFGLLVLNNIKTFLTFKLSEEPLATNVFTYLSSSSFIAAITTFNEIINSFQVKKFGYYHDPTEPIR